VAKSSAQRTSNPWHLPHLHPPPRQWNQEMEIAIGTDFVLHQLHPLITIKNCSGKDRNLNIAELLCCVCNRWYHESCIGYQLGKLVPFMMNYVFFCKNCSASGLESFKKNQAGQHTWT
jgi:hypothetical protein